MKVGFLFPGQGSQSVGMLSDYQDLGSEILDHLEWASEAIGIDIVAIVAQGPEDLLNQTEITQPAILAVSVGLFALCQKLCVKVPDAAAGHSLGEYSALVASGALEFETAVRLVHRRGQVMQSAVPIGTGAMAAVLGLSDDEVSQICDSFDGTVEVANYNCPGQVVIAGIASEVKKASLLCSERGARRVVPIAMSVPSHCSLLRSASDQFREVLSPVRFLLPGLDIFQNVNASKVSDPNQIKQNLIRQLSSSVLWHQSVRTMINAGVDTFVECGPGKVLTGLMRRIDRNVNAIALSDRPTFEEFVRDFT